MNTIQLSRERQAQIIGVMIFCAHWHTGQGSRLYRVGCRARELYLKSNVCAASYVMSRLYDTLEHYAAGDTQEPPSTCLLDYADMVRGAYARMKAIAA